MLRAVSIAVILLGTSPLALSQNTLDPTQMTDGQNIRIDEAIVRAKTGNLLRVEVNHEQFFVAPVDPSSIEHIAVGARLDISGTLRRPPTAPQAQMSYAVSPSEAQRLAETPFYIVAWSISALY